MRTMIRTIMMITAAVTMYAATNGSTGSPQRTSASSVQRTSTGAPVAATNDAFFTMNVAGSIAENAMVLNRASFISANELTLDVSGLFTVSPTASLLFLYEFLYDGPGVSPQDAERMSERAQDHTVVIKYIHEILPTLTLSGRIDGTAEFYKLSQNEPWGSGIYDYLRGGGEIEAAWNYFGAHSAVLSYSAGYLYFPRFTDLYTEYLTGSSLNQEVSRESHVLHTAVLTAENDIHETFSYRAVYRFTARQFVNAGYTRADGSFDAGAYQIGLAHTVMADIAFDLGPIIPGLGIDHEYSSASGYYLKPFGTNGLNIPVNYDYADVRVRLMLAFVLSKEVRATVSGSYGYKYYPHFPIQDVNGMYQAEKMYTKTLVAGLSWNFKLGEYYRLIPSYSFKWVDANNKYGDGTAFNYDVHALGVVFSFDY